MKYIYHTLMLVACMLLTLTLSAVAIDSTSANLTGQILGGLYTYLSPQIPAAVQTFIAALLGLGIPLLANFQATLKSDPNKQKLTGIIGWILDAMTWFVKDVPAPGSSTTDTPPTEDKK